jgi:hypothetical protein
MSRLLLALAMTVVWTTGLSAAATAQEKRVALVIGNSA